MLTNPPCTLLGLQTKYLVDALLEASALLTGLTLNIIQRSSGLWRSPDEVRLLCRKWLASHYLQGYYK
jgi:hypothetical protein